MRHWRDTAAIREEEGKMVTALQSLVLIVVFFALFVVGLNWRFSSPPQTVIQVSLVPAPVKLPTPISQPKPAPLPITDPQPKKPTKADIALKKKHQQEEKRKKKEQQRKEEEKRKEKEQQRKEEEARKKKEIKTQKEEARKRQEEQQRQDTLEKQRLAEAAKDKAARAATLEKISNSFVNRIIARIESRLTTPPSAQNIDKDKLEVVVEVQLERGGDLVDTPKVLESSGLPEYDKEAVRAVMKAAPLPMPTEPELLEDFKKLRLRIRPEKGGV